MFNPSDLDIAALVGLTYNLELICEPPQIPHRLPQLLRYRGDGSNTGTTLTITHYDPTGATVSVLEFSEIRPLRYVFPTFDLMQSGDAEDRVVLGFDTRTEY